ncbi:hypothetical protein GCM10020219_057870 [Nonomuraea dietziae]
MALWLWLVLIKHVQTRRATPDEPGGTAEPDILPFRGHREAPPLTGSAEQEPEPTPVIGPTAAPETPPVSQLPSIPEPSIPVSERVARWEAESHRRVEAERRAVPEPRLDPDPLDLEPRPDPDPSGQAPAGAPGTAETHPAGHPTDGHPTEARPTDGHPAEGPAQRTPPRRSPSERMTP